MNASARVVKTSELPPAVDMARALDRLESVIRKFERLAAGGTHADLPGNGQEPDQCPAVETSPRNAPIADSSPESPRGSS